VNRDLPPWTGDDPWMQDWVNARFNEIDAVPLATSE
jgi:hypothetical protein